MTTVTIKPHTHLAEQVVKTCVEKCIPYAVQFELTSKCNLSCKHCFMTDDDSAELSSEEIKGIIDQLVEMGTFFLAFTVGEIFTRDDLFDIVRYANDKGFFMTFMTNATLIRPEHINEIKKLKPVKFEISLYGATAKTHDHITNVDGSFKRTVTAIEALIESGIEVLIKTPLMNLNIKEADEIAAFVEDLGAAHRMNPGIAPMQNGSLDPLQYDISNEDMKAYLIDHDFDLSYLLDMDPLNRFSCKAGKAACCITPGGIVYPCVMMPIPVGDLHEKSFKEIWHLKPADELNRLRTLTSRDLTTCPTCDFTSYCVRCPGVVYLETGDLVGPSQSACRYALWRKEAAKSINQSNTDPHLKTRISDDGLSAF
ncbi:MAG: radical SAM protein [ANME-2 cluster archaeon]|nr:MAG: radical SAM protein [ANME-2 cluster archaeon]